MTEESIYEGMLEVFARETGYTLSHEAETAVRLRAAAAQLMSLYHYGDYVLRQAFPQTAQQEHLDSHGALRGVTRISGEKARGVLRFGISQALAVDLVIPAGTVCRTAEGTAFHTLEDGVLTAGTLAVEIDARALEEGPEGNVLAGQVTGLQTPIDGIETVLNPEAFSGGRAEETDEAFRQRILEAYVGLSNGSNISYYRQLALSVGGIDHVRVIPRISGVGTVGILVASNQGTVSQEALDTLDALLADRRELGISVTVLTPETVGVTVTARIRPGEGYTLDQAKAAVETALTECFLGDRMGKTLYRSRLIHSAMATGTIENILLTAPSEDVTVEDVQQPVLETLTVEGM